jgi:hypothetical protein
MSKKTGLAIKKMTLKNPQKNAIEALEANVLNYRRIFKIFGLTLGPIIAKLKGKSWVNSSTWVMNK